ncbi:PREDICTED: uncharacterized protein LOC109334003 [Lupinus angustifolius]|uniref:uncharacterized protein LOC109334003 n=1 Tax=Lupinus angustifolius TaxID=3871 RepID=UPI00092EF0BC|nr:PREDICTED: uncharacterized protein LOC109334003 [Lupinus angustifolius]
MEDQETIADYFTRIRTLTNVMRSHGERIPEQSIIEKILRTLFAKLDHVVVAIEESKDLEILKIDELQGSLEAHEQRFIKRMSDIQSQQALSAQFKKKKNFENFVRHNKDNGKWNPGKKIEEDKLNNTGRGYSRSNSTNLNHDVESGNAKKGNHKFGGKKKMDKSKIQCFNCKRWGHFASECKLRMRGKDVEFSLAKEEDSDEEVLLMAEGKVSNLQIRRIYEKVLMVTTKGDQQLSSNN